MIELVFTPLILLPNLAGLQQASEDPADRLLRAMPADAIAVLSTAGWDDIRARAAQNSWIKFSQDPCWEALRFGLVEGFKEGFEEGFGEEIDETWAAIDPLEVISSVHGPLACAFTHSEFGWEACALVDAGKSSGFKDFFELAWNELVASESRNSVLEYGGVRILLIDGRGGDPNLALLEVDGVFGIIVHEDPESIIDRIHEIVDKLKGQCDEDGFLGTTAHAAAQHGWSRAPAMRLALNGEGLFEALSKEMDDEDATSIFTELGFLDIQWAYLNMDIGQGENLDFDGGLHLPNNTVIGDFADLLGTAPIGILKRLPADCSSLTLANFDVFGAWNLALEVLSNFSQDGYDSVRVGLATTREMWDIDIEQELLSQITGNFAAFSMPVPEEEVAPGLAEFGIDTEGLFHESKGFLVQLEDPYTVEDALEKLLLITGVGSMVEEADFQGHTFQTLDLGLQRPMWGFTDDTFIYSNSATPMYSALRRAETDKAEQEHLARFKKILAGCGPEVGVVSISDTRTSIEMMIGALGMLNLILQATGLGDPMFNQLAWLAFPEQDIAGAYFKGTLIHRISRMKDAMYFTFQAR